MSLWPGKTRIMRTMTVVLALGAVLALSTAVQARPKTEVRPVVDRHARLRITVPVVRSDPFWVPDYYIVPRYRYRPEDDRVDTSPYAPPVAPGDVEFGGLGIGQ
jgi:hypothetical protein